MRVDITKAGNRLQELISQSVGGKEVVITRNGQPVVKLLPLDRRKRRFGSARGLIKMSDDFDEPLEDFRDYM
ncbi:Type II toxin-antitoxin system prevent-host-death family antitoxin [Candidatus Desulfarcum epimagneticum]|uniref:Antitoxin n=1 Tax=uncultured Desulfobacteraceae bacterium TaxID=218296 RepID=A0A484HG90_9BACT|nr:Type II toxin-antitoxin system prevent-host-death family antitoxin [uncultured Desulfobacteraceae bacterium]